MLQVQFPLMPRCFGTSKKHRKHHNVAVSGRKQDQHFDKRRKDGVEMVGRDVVRLSYSNMAFCCFGLQCRHRPKGARAFPRYGCLAAPRPSTVSMGFKQLNG